MVVNMWSAGQYGPERLLLFYYTFERKKVWDVCNIPEDLFLAAVLI